MKKPLFFLFLFLFFSFFINQSYADEYSNQIESWVINSFKEQSVRELMSVTSYWKIKIILDNIKRRDLDLSDAEIERIKIRLVDKEKIRLTHAFDDIPYLVNNEKYQERLHDLANSFHDSLLELRDIYPALSFLDKDDEEFIDNARTHILAALESLEKAVMYGMKMNFRYYAENNLENTSKSRKWIQRGLNALSILLPLSTIGLGVYFDQSAAAIGVESVLALLTTQMVIPGYLNQKHAEKTKLALLEDLNHSRNLSGLPFFIKIEEAGDIGISLKDIAPYNQFESIRKMLDVWLDIPVNAASRIRLLSKTEESSFFCAYNLKNKIAESKTIAKQTQEIAPLEEEIVTVEANQGAPAKAKEEASSY